LSNCTIERDFGRTDGRTDRQTDRHEEDKIRLSKFCEENSRQLYNGYSFFKFYEVLKFYI